MRMQFGQGYDVRTRKTLQDTHPIRSARAVAQRHGRTAGTGFRLKWYRALKMTIISKHRIFALLMAVMSLLPIAYLVAFIEQSTNKGWRTREAGEVANILANHLNRSGSSIKVNTAQQYTDGCSFFLFEIYRRSCFSVRLSVPLSTDISHIDLEEYVNLVKETLSSKNSKSQASALNSTKDRPKITLVIEGFQITLEPDGTKRTLRQELKRITFEEQ